MLYVFGCDRCCTFQFWRSERRRDLMLSERPELVPNVVLRSTIALAIVAARFGSRRCSVMTLALWVTD